MQEAVSNRDPFERLEVLQAKVKEVFALGGLDSDSSYAGRVFSKLKSTSVEANQRRSKLINNGCQYPDHWDWQSYLVRIQYFMLYSHLNLRKAKPTIASIVMIHVWPLNKFSSVSNVGFKYTQKTVTNLPSKNNFGTQLQGQKGWIELETKFL